MATTKMRVPTEEEKHILRKNGIDPEGVSVFLREEDMIRIICHKTRDEITIHNGGKKWS